MGGGRQRKFIRRQQGTAFAEVAVVGFIMTLVLAFILDIAIALMAFSVVDRACRDAARAAAQGQSRDEARQMAAAIANDHLSASPLVTAPIVTNVVYEDFGGDPSPDQCPFVEVTTSATASVPAPLFLFGTSGTNRPLTLAKRYRFPIVKLKMPANPNPGP
ncbi:MAG: hypothetical protein K2X93_17610 [Candidatus Obscuribacterales bacterium]|nr:hypothetical protein [Candidatus Obscuribacterales bacterium]